MDAGEIVGGYSKETAGMGLSLLQEFLQIESIQGIDNQTSGELGIEIG